jgi:hypothetical protein
MSASAVEFRFVLSAAGSPSRHEAMVAAFMAAAKRSDPERFRLICSRYPVLAGSALRRRLSLEVLVGDTAWLATFVGSIGPGFIDRAAPAAPAPRR